MPRPFTPLQAHENPVFLDALVRTGNARLAGRAAGRPAAREARRRFVAVSRSVPPPGHHDWDRLKIVGIGTKSPSHWGEMR